MKVRYLGHSAFLLEDLVIDPYLSGNPKCQIKPEEIRCKIVCVTHDHKDHIGDAFEIAKNNDATIVAIHEIAEKAAQAGLKAEGMNIGGTIRFKNWIIRMVNAQHSSYTGAPAGFYLRNIETNCTIYHAGDTGFFGDMRLIGMLGVNIAMIPIGGRYTMDIGEAVMAIELIKPKKVIPMHYGTTPLIDVDPLILKEMVGEWNPDIPIEIFEIGEEREL